MSNNVHEHFGPILLAPSYDQQSYYAISRSIIPMEKEKQMRLIFDRVDVGCGVGLMVRGKLAVQVRVAATLSEEQFVRILDCGFPAARIMHFNPNHLKEGIKRVIL